MLAGEYVSWVIIETIPWIRGVVRTGDLQRAALGGHCQANQISHH